jgi:hypothetical protein
LGNGIRLQAVAVSVNSRPTRALPRWRVLRSPPTALIQPKLSSSRGRSRWLIA